ncbi:GNAT family N-acetyltransferase [Pelagibius sp. 7325]|uniref:GNAT family N-acetyltransferase n=1 Tax=Pelagibius sp. 7325 TaxID=3131994 RepID=UPI0030EB3D6C
MTSQPSSQPPKATPGDPQAFVLRAARRGDIPAIDAMHFLSVQALSAADYSPAEVEAFLCHGTYDPALIDDGTYYVLAAAGPEAGGRVIASGGWSRHLPHSNAGGAGMAEPAYCLSPTSAKIRSIFVHPHYARRGLGSRMVRHAEREAVAAGHRLLELWATLTGLPLYRRLGYQELGRMAIPGGNGAAVPAVHMARLVPLSDAQAA